MSAKIIHPHLLIYDLFARSKSEQITFLQVGTNDGCQSDFLRSRALRYNYSGVLIEPHPHYLNLAIENYQGNKNFTFLNVAISDDECERELYFVKQEFITKSYMLGIASFKKQNLTSQHHLDDHQIESIRVKCVRLESIIKKYSLYDVDLLVVDVEGFELNVFKSIDFSVFRPKLIIFETAHMSKSDFLEISNLIPDCYFGTYLENDSVFVRYAYEPPRFG